MSSPLHVVIAGGGVAGLEAALALRKLAEERVTVDVIAPHREFVYRPLAVAEPFRVAEMRRFPLEPLVRAAGGVLRHGRVASVDTDLHRVSTVEGPEQSYDVLVLALGAQAREAVPGALTFRGAEDGSALATLLEEATYGTARRLAFVVPAAATWSLPLYELALLTQSYLADRGAMGRELRIVTPEPAPLALFGLAASAAVRELLDIRGIALRTEGTPVAFEAPTLLLASGDSIAADRAVALPRLKGARPLGVPHDADGFVPTDEHGRVRGTYDVYAAGDLTTFPIKQGGIAAQQADAAAASIAALAGAPVEPQPFRPVLRGQLLTGLYPRYLRADPVTGVSSTSVEPLWWPPAKVVGRHLAPFLAERLGLPEAERPPAPGIPIDVALARSE
jgi:sulfide:quinone oxidoreductase